MAKSGNRKRLNSSRRRMIGALSILILGLAAAGGDKWSIFEGQVNGPVKRLAGIDLESFRLKHYPGVFWSEGYYHHLNFPDGSMITVSIGFNPKEIQLAFVWGKPGMEPFNDYLMIDFNKTRFEDQGFGCVFAKNRFWLDGDQYHMVLDFKKVRARITLDLLAPSYSYGDSMLRYPDGKSYAYYSLPIPWARAHVDAVLDGKEVKLEGFGNMNHDAGTYFPGYTPSNWQAFWFFGEDHALAITDFFSHREFGRKLVQRLVFVDKNGRMFTSTDFELTWDDWAPVEGIRFKYPRHFKLRAEGGGAKLEGDIRMKEFLLLEDLYSNLPPELRPIIEKLTRNGWTMDYWAEYTLTYSHASGTDTYHGKGVVRYTDLEEGAR